MTTTIQKWGNSLAVRISKKVAENVGLFDGSTIFLRESGGKIIIEPKRTLLNLKNIMKKYKPETYHREIDWGKFVGSEI